MAGADLLADLDRRQVASRAAAIGDTQKARGQNFLLLRMLQSLKYAMKSVHSPADQFDAVGFDPPATSRKIVTPQTPQQLSVTGFSNGINALRFVGNNTPNTVTYIVEAKTPASERYSIVGASKAQQFKHTGVRPGTFYQYRVRAQSARGSVSDWSNEAVVYRL